MILAPVRVDAPPQATLRHLPWIRIVWSWTMVHTWDRWLSQDHIWIAVPFAERFPASLMHRFLPSRRTGPLAPWLAGSVTVQVNVIAQAEPRLSFALIVM